MVPTCGSFRGVGRMVQGMTPCSIWMPDTAEPVPLLFCAAYHTDGLAPMQLIWRVWEMVFFLICNMG